MKLGNDHAPDILSVSLSATDYVGHAFGTEGEEMCLQMFALDRELGDFLAALDAMHLDYAVALTADHGGEDLPERLREAGNAAATRIDASLLVRNVGKAVAQKLGLSGPVLLGGPMGDVWLDSALTSRQRTSALAEAATIYRSSPQVEAVFTNRELEAVPLPSGAPDKWTLVQRARASFDAERSGDLIVLLKPGVTPIADPFGGFVATHGSPWDYDRRVPILFWRSGMPPSNRAEAVDTTDIMPTLAAMIGIPLTVAIDGRCLGGIAGIACPIR
jgi:predicted AlkP superfamily pyrophosphatase or phosphodiesterase